MDKEFTQDGAEMNDESMELTDEELESVTGGLSDMGKRFLMESMKTKKSEGYDKGTFMLLYPFSRKSLKLRNEQKAFVEENWDNINVR